MRTSTPPRHHPLLGRPPPAAVPAESMPGREEPGRELLLFLFERRLRHGQLGVAVERAVRLKALLAEAQAQER